MSRPLALVRPEPGWSATAAAARAAGLAVVGHPLFDVQPLPWSPPPGPFDALLIGSAAVFRCGGAGLAALTHLPVFAVGTATAEAARNAGFAVDVTGDGDLQDVLDACAGSPRRFLRLTGEERVPVTPHPGQSVAECAVYRLRALGISPAFAHCLAMEVPLVALHSAAAARHFATAITASGLARSRLSLLALSERIAEAAGPGWAAVHVAARPADAALLAKARALCE